MCLKERECQRPRQRASTPAKHTKQTAPKVRGWKGWRRRWSEWRERVQEEEVAGDEGRQRRGGGGREGGGEKVKGEGVAEE